MLWGRMARGERDVQIARWTESLEKPIDRGTIAKARKKLEALPEESARDLPEEVKRLWKYL